MLMVAIANADPQIYNAMVGRSFDDAGLALDYTVLILLVRDSEQKSAKLAHQLQILDPKSR